MLIDPTKKIPVITVSVEKAYDDLPAVAHALVLGTTEPVVLRIFGVRRCTGRVVNAYLCHSLAFGYYLDVRG